MFYSRPPFPPFRATSQSPPGAPSVCSLAPGLLHFPRCDEPVGVAGLRPHSRGRWVYLAETAAFPGRRRGVCIPVSRSVGHCCACVRACGQKKAPSPLGPC